MFQSPVGLVSRPEAHANASPGRYEHSGFSDFNGFSDFILPMAARLRCSSKISAPPACSFCKEVTPMYPETATEIGQIEQGQPVIAVP